MIESGSSTLREILRHRPMAVEVFEAAFGHRFWDDLESRCVAFCGQHGADCEDLLGRIRDLPVPPHGTDWDAKPIHWLVDRLTADHEAFRGTELPALENMLVAERLPAYPDGYVVKLLVQEFRRFRSDFLKHMAEEEEFLFPKILRNEACYRHPEIGSEVYRGSVNLYLRFKTHKPEEEFKAMIVSIRDKLRNQHMGRPAAALAREAQDAMDAFARRLSLHADLETESLFPRAGRLEQMLYEHAVPGLSRFPGDEARKPRGLASRP